jgi:Zn-dependent alcohol dehydrogenase
VLLPLARRLPHAVSIRRKLETPIALLTIRVAFQLVTGRVWKGCAFGGVKGRSQLPDLVGDYLDGKLKVDEFITHRKPLAEINPAFEAMKAGDCIRCVVTMKDDA